jgi:hypothetical protein
MPSRRDQIVADIVSALEGVGKPAGLTVHRFRTRSFKSEQFPAIVVYLGDEDSGPATRPHQSMTDNKVRVVCACREVATGDQSPDEALDPLTSWVEVALMADPTRGGLAVTTQKIQTSWDATEADEQYAAAGVVLEVRYLTAADDPAAAN